MNDPREAIKYSAVGGNGHDFDENVSIGLTPTIDMKNNDEFIGNSVSKSEIAKSDTRKFLYIAACTGNLASFICGISFGWTSPVIPKLNGKVEPESNPLAVVMSSEEESWLGSLLPVGAALGPFIAGMLTDKLGRKKTLLISISPFIIGFLIAAFAKSAFILCAVRLMWGFGVGGVFTVIPMYIGEISEDAVRGALGSFMQLFITFGLLFSYAIGPYVSITAFNIACLVIPIVFIPVFMIYIPESPYYLLASGNDAEAVKALHKLRNKSSSEVLYELAEMKGSIQESMRNKGHLSDILKSKGLIKALIISVALVALQQLSGINVILFYTQTIFAATGSSIPAEICTIITGIVQVLSSFITPALVDKLGKRFLLLFSAVGMCVSEGILGYYFYLQEKKENLDAVFWLPILCLIGYNITYCMGFGPLPWAVMGELFPSNVKSAASTVTASACWILAFIITKFFANVTDIIGIAGSFWIFTGCCGFGAGFVYWYVPETSGKSLTEIQLILSGSSRP